MLYKIKDVDDKAHFIFIVAENVNLRVTDWTTHGNPIVRTTGNAVGLIEAGLIKIKCTSNGYDYIYVR